MAILAETQDNIFLVGNRLAFENNLSETDVMNEIKAFRNEK